MSVKGVSADTPSRLSGIEFDDKIRMYALISKGEIGVSNTVYTSNFSLEADIKRAYRERKSVLLLLERPRHTVTYL